MERLFKILRSKFDRFEQTPPEGAFENILGSLMDEDDNRSKRRAFGGHGFLLFSSLIAVTTLAGTFILNRNNFDVALKHEGSYSAKSSLSLVATNNSVSGNNQSTENSDDKNANQSVLLIPATDNVKSISGAYGVQSFLPWAEANAGSLYNGTEIAAANYISFLTNSNRATQSSNKIDDILADNNNLEDRENSHISDSKIAITKQSSKHTKSKTYHAKKRKNRKSVKYKYTGKQSFEVKDPFSVYGQKSKQGYYLDSVELAELDRKKKEELEAEDPIMEEAKIIEPKFLETTSRFAFSLALDKLYYVSAITHDAVNTATADLINYRETGESCQQSFNVHYNLSKNLELSAGIGHRSFKSVYDADRLTDSVKTSLVDVDPVDPDASNTDTEEEIRRPLYYKGKNQSHFLTLPISISYNNSIGKLKIFAGFGLNTNILLYSKQHLSTKFKQNDEVIKDNNENIAAINQFSFALNPSVGLVYPLSNRLDLSIGTSGLFYMSNLYASKELKSTPMLMGGNVGIRFRMN